jgi:hypothetical protein
LPPFLPSFYLLKKDFVSFDNKNFTPDMNTTTTT